MSHIVISERAAARQARPSLAPFTSCATLGCAAPARTLISTGHAFCGAIACTVRSMLLMSGSWLSFQALSLPGGAVLVDAGLSSWTTFVTTCDVADLTLAARLIPQSIWRQVNGQDRREIDVLAWQIAVVAVSRRWWTLMAFVGWLADVSLTQSEEAMAA